MDENVRTRTEVFEFGQMGGILGKLEKNRLNHLGIWVWDLLLHLKQNCQMIGYLLFGLTFLIYIAMGAFSLQPSPSGDKFGYAYSAFVLIIAYALCSLLLTIYIVATGGFNWISETTIKRNIIVAILWLSMMTVAYCTLGRTEYHKFYQLTGFVRLLSFVIYYAAVWAPLLILIPYFYLLKPEERDTISPVFVKTPLVLGCIVGILLLLMPKIMSGVLLKSFKEFDERELAFNAAMDNIEKYQAVMSLLYYASDYYDEQIRSAALTKIKASKTLEAELIEILEHGSSPYPVFEFLEEHKVEHPERFIEPIVKSFARITADMHEGIVSPYKGGAFDIGALLRVLEGQFNGSIAIFKPHIIKLQEVMDTPPAKSRVYDDVEQCNAKLNKYREEVKSWLARH